MEEQEGHDILKAGAQLEAEVGPARAVVVLDILEMCTTKIVPDLRSQRRHYQGGKLPKVPKGQKAAVVSALNDVATDEDLSAVAAAIEVARTIPASSCTDPRSSTTSRQPRNAAPGAVRMQA